MIRILIDWYYDMRAHRLLLRDIRRISGEHKP